MGKPIMKIWDSAQQKYVSIPAVKGGKGDAGTTPYIGANGNWYLGETDTGVKATVPTSLKNPNALTIKIGSTTVTYDGSSAQTVEIADGTEVSY